MVFNFFLFVFILVELSLAQECLPKLSRVQKKEFSTAQQLARQNKISHQEYLQKHPIYQQTKNMPDEELLTRSVFAEGVSTYFYSLMECTKQSPLIFQAIAWGIKNRVDKAEKSTAHRKRFGQGIRGILFHLDQFNPSVSPNVEYSRLFACPTSYYEGRDFRGLSCHKNQKHFTKKNFEKYWQLAKGAAQVVMDKKSVKPFQATSFYYPLYVYSSGQQCRQYKKPSWASHDKSLKNVKINGQSLSTECVWFFND